MAVRAAGVPVRVVAGVVSVILAHHLGERIVERPVFSAQPLDLGGGAEVQHGSALLPQLGIDIIPAIEPVGSVVGGELGWAGIAAQALTPRSAASYVRSPIAHGALVCVLDRHGYLLS